MKRDTVSVSLPSNLVGRKYKKFYENFLQHGSDCLKSEIEALSKTEPYRFSEMQYLEDDTNEVRKVTCINFGIPCQATVYFYR